MRMTIQEWEVPEAGDKAFHYKLAHILLIQCDVTSFMCPGFSCRSVVVTHFVISKNMTGEWLHNQRQPHHERKGK